ncbi:MAG: hypothetical protein P1P88_10520, partial [Bacteroidales bacterium]|nr:hypothetical protein [Bacteroidales bacterium]
MLKFINLTRQFSLLHSIDNEIVLKVLPKIIDFDHKKKNSTMFIKKQFYGDNYEINKFSIWSKSFTPGFLNKKTTLRIDFEIKNNRIDFRIDDGDIFIFLFFSFFLVLIGIMILILMIGEIGLNIIALIVSLILIASPFFVLKLGQNSIVYAERQVISYFNSKFSTLGYKFKIKR